MRTILRFKAQGRRKFWQILSCFEKHSPVLKSALLLESDGFLEFRCYLQFWQTLLNSAAAAAMLAADALKISFWLKDKYNQAGKRVGRSNFN